MMSRTCGSVPSSYCRSYSETSPLSRSLTGRIQTPALCPSNFRPATHRPLSFREFARQRMRWTSDMGMAEGDGGESSVESTSSQCLLRNNRAGRPDPDSRAYRRCSSRHLRSAPMLEARCKRLWCGVLQEGLCWGTVVGCPFPQVPRVATSWPDSEQEGVSATPSHLPSSAHVTWEPTPRAPKAGGCVRRRQPRRDAATASRRSTGSCGRAGRSRRRRWPARRRSGRRVRSPPGPRRSDPPSRPGTRRRGS